MKRLAGIAMVRNEADIIEPFIRHNLQFLDELIIVLHSCVDATPHIVARLAAEGLNITVERNHELGFRKVEWMNKIAREVLKTKRADFIFMLDADEFIKTPSRAYLHEAVALIPDGMIAALKWQSYVPTSDDCAQENHLLKRITHRCHTEAQCVHKVTVCERFLNDTSLVITDGNHAVARRADSARTFMPHVAFKGVSLAHFPVRSEAQLVGKAVIGTWSRWLENDGVDKKMAVSQHWLHFYQEVMHGGAITADRLRDFALDYQLTQHKAGGTIDRCLVSDPIAATFELKYTQPNAMNAMANIGQWVEQLITQSREAVPLQRQA